MNFNIQKKLYLTNIFLIDWDDTLFPSSWVNNNKINLQNEDSRNEYKLYFLELDNVVSKFLESLNDIGDIFIVTNANLNWIKTCLNILSLTSKVIILNKIRILSARDIYSTRTDSPSEWKILTFRDVVLENLKKINNIRDNTYLNILSLGDAKYEYIALLNLNNYLLKNDTIKKYIKNNNFNFLLKSIKFIDNPQFEYIIDQLNFVEQNKDSIINKLEFIDLKFD
jgi:hypothetical protein